jgi:PAP2 superfamily
MRCIRHVMISLLAIVISGSLIAQQEESIVYSPDLFEANNETVTKEVRLAAGPRITLKSLIIPVTLISYGVFAQCSNKLKRMDVRIKNVVRRDPDFHTKIDNYLQYAPSFAVYALNAAGVKGKNNFRDRTITYLLSNAMMGITVQAIKKITRVARPEGCGTNAFPSGHTATAFAGAEFLRQEYKDVSPWYGIAGYVAATTTGALRMFNNKHWFRDVVAGAGFGILSTQVAYVLAPIIIKKLFHKKPVNHFDPANL